MKTKPCDWPHGPLAILVLQLTAPATKTYRNACEYRYQHDDKTRPARRLQGPPAATSPN